MSGEWWRAAPPWPTGEQFTIRLGSQEATVTEIGAGLRAYTVDGRSVLDGFAADTLPGGSRGQVLLPWPNRLAGGTYTFGGQTLQVPLNEPARGNAIHGLTRWLPWTLLARETAAVTLGLLLRPQPGYPFTLALEQRYSLQADGLAVRTSAYNAGQQPLPFGAGQHPYFTVGTPLIDEAHLRLPASAYLTTDDRMIPTGRASVAGTPFDFRAERPVGATVLDCCYTDLARDPDGWARVHLAHPSGTPRLAVALDAAHGFVQAFTGDTLSDAAARRRGLAIEPMTCAPNAFVSGDGLRTLAPGERFSAEWRVEVS